MNKLDTLSTSQKPLLACYLPFADPLLPADLPKVYADCGVDIIEYGLPCGSPYADGPIVAASMRRAYLKNAGLEGIADYLARQKEILPEQSMVLMGYKENMDVPYLLGEIGQFIDGVLCLGDNIAHGASWQYGDKKIHKIVFLPHDFSGSELTKASAARGYIMLQSVAGLTGIREDIPDNKKKIDEIKNISADVPVLLGFGISKKDHVRKSLAMGANGVVIGSACLDYAVKQDLRGLEIFLKEVRTTLDDC